MDHFEQELARMMRDNHEDTAFEDRHRHRLQAGVRARRRARTAWMATGSVLTIAGLGVGLMVLPNSFAQDGPTGPQRHTVTSAEPVPTQPTTRPVSSAKEVPVPVCPPITEPVPRPACGSTILPEPMPYRHSTTEPAPMPYRRSTTEPVPMPTTELAPTPTRAPTSR